ncbi:MAG: DoxX family membrane protein [Elusimicrobia bacterium]|nr:DoxX family membrane protein [Elusimicrobiota bacterium]
MKTALAVAARIAVGAVFIWGGFQHAVNPPEEFAVVMESYYILPPSYLIPLATFLPWAELWLGAFLIAGYKTRLSATGIAAMLLVFEIALISAKARGIPLQHCGCFGSSLRLPPEATIALDIVLLGCAWAAFRNGRDRWSLDDWISAGR